jgi:hypothetical protein
MKQKIRCSANGSINTYPKATGLLSKSMSHLKNIYALDLTIPQHEFIISK